MRFEYEQPLINPESMLPTREQTETAKHLLAAYEQAHAELERLLARVKHAEEQVQQAVRDLGNVADEDASMRAWLMHHLYWDTHPVRVSFIAEAFGVRTYDVQQVAKLHMPCERCGRPIREPSHQQGLLCCRICELAKHTEEH